MDLSSVSENDVTVKIGGQERDLSAVDVYTNPQVNIELANSVDSPSAGTSIEITIDEVGNPSQGTSTDVTVSTHDTSFDPGSKDSSSSEIDGQTTSNAVTASASAPYFRVENVDNPRVAANSDQITTDVTVENDGNATGSQNITLSFDTSGAVADTRIDKNVTLDPGESTTESVTFNTASLNGSDNSTVVDYDVDAATDNSTLTNTLSVGTNSSGAVEVTVSDDLQPDQGETTDVELYTLEDFNNNEGPFRTATTDGDGKVNFRNLAVGPNESNSQDYVAKAAANDPNFRSTTTTLTLYDDSQTSDSNTVFIERITNADSLKIESYDPSSSVDLGQSIAIDTLVETEDKAGSGLDPLEGSTVKLQSATRVSGEATLDFSNVDNTTDSDSNGIATFENLTTDQDFEDLDEDTTFNITFEAIDSGASAASTAQSGVGTTATTSTTAYAEVTFRAEPPSGDGTIHGEVDQYDKDIELGTENADSASGVSVHAFQLTRAAQNTLGGNVSGGDSVTGTFGADAEENSSLTVAANNNETVRGIVWNTTSNSVVEVLDVRSDYMFKGDDLSVSRNLTVPGTGFDAENDGGNTGWYSVTFLENDSEIDSDHTYAVQIAPDGNFSNGATNRTLSSSQNDLTYEGIQNRYSDVQAVHTDVTDSEGNFNLLNLYTNGSDGTAYVIMASEDNAELGFANANGYDIIDPVKQSADATDEQLSAYLGVQETEEDIVADTVNITQFGEHPPLAETGGSPDVTQIDEFTDKTDSTYQRVSRDASVDVIRIDTRSEEFDTDVAANVTVNLNNTSGFDGEFLDVVLDSNLNADSSLLLTNESNTATTPEIEISTDDSGTAYVLLEADNSSDTINRVKNASLNNPPVSPNQTTDSSNVTFVGVNEFDTAGVSGISRDSDDTLVPLSVIWAEEFEWGDDYRFEIEPDTNETPGTGAYAEYVDNASADWTVTLYENQSGTYTPIENDTVDRDGLTTYSFGAFPQITASNDFQLLDVAADPESASYTLEPVPAVTGDDVATEYTLRGVKLDEPEKGVESLDGLFDVMPGEGETQNVIFPFDIEPANLLASGLDDQSIDEGENVTVTADIENTGGNQSDQQTVEFSVDGTVLNSTTVELTSGQSTTVEFTGDTSDLSNGTYDMTVTTEDDTTSATLTVNDTGPSNPAPSWAQPYVNDSTGITDELDLVLDAIDAYENGNLGANALDKVLAIIDSYENEEVVEDV